MQSQPGNPFVVAQAPAEQRAAFIRETYFTLAGAIFAFVALEAVFIGSSWAPDVVRLMTGGQYSWLIVLGAFMGVSWLADAWARSNVSQALQYVGLGLFVAAEAFLFLPLLYIASNFSSPDVIPMAAIITGLLFAGLTATAFMTRKDFSFMRGILAIGGFVALGVIVCSMLFGFQLGLLFSAVMVLFAGGSILYTTSNIIHHYRTDQPVAAALALFSSVMLLFWYVLRILMAARR
ncbi:Bax inhibitor-1/YccA family protein [Actomonas aquatica]|uniref:Bax inhibitor-1 family protein n=1 Tax=Actomonas aquatica TaxID=2866162 RepID=A0ABZ1C7J0_9BACT|nr:Bax inhibitor-1 family protein [Opitutus sp. WL0086]WRQ87471.1 Bax inhibitor-1 family protein [Opitutus sp. WL0086]